MKYLRSWAAMGAIVALFTLADQRSIVAAAPPAQEHPLLSVGNPGPRALDLKISVHGPDSSPSEKPAPTYIQLEAPAKVYVTAVYVSSLGDFVLVFPNKESPDNLLVSGKQITLFGPGSRAQLKQSKVVKDAKIVFFVSSKPLMLDPLKAPSGKVFLEIPHSAAGEQKILLSKIEEMSKDEGFNRKIIDLKTGMRPVIRLDVMGVDEDVKSRKPGTVTGVQGVQGEKEAVNKE